ncbi:hypothetical protein J2D73_03315 [Acetobacter sacchari]|uniref:Glycosyl transferase n=1 Tax=Acetobacter sacchari TaxID=2661687 RepID=A0ABS3LSE1_9PROT|nr:rhamnan synthesis F family protein [Acetobacter sacchari]MBO1358829.1 hypothetical protein [Acetobacter sacchari]
MTMTQDGREHVVDSGLFDAAWYQARLPNAGRDIADPLDHFMTVGVREGLPPGPLFDPSRYFARSWHLEAGVDNALLHYLLAGRAAGVVGEGVCDTALRGGDGPVEPTLLTGPPSQPRSLAIAIHVSRPEVFQVICQRLATLPCHYTLLILTDSVELRSVCEAIAESAGIREPAIVRPAPVRGYNIASVFSVFRNALRHHEFALFLHTEVGADGRPVFGELRQNLLPHPDAFGGLFSRLVDDAALGLLQPTPASATPYWAFGWVGQEAQARAALRRLKPDAQCPEGYFDYPAGGMFWARTRALAPFLDMAWTDADFRVAARGGVADAAALFERAIGVIVRGEGFRCDEYDAQAGLIRVGWGRRNFDRYEAFSSARLKIAVEEARVVSFDIFDTLLQRIALTPDAVQRYAGWLVERAYPEIQNFVDRRKSAEDTARAALDWTDDVGLDEIYSRLEEATGWSAESLAFARSREEELDARQLQPRPGMLEVLRHARQRGSRVILVSDTYLRRTELDPILARTGVLALVDEIYLSSERFARKDRGDMWDLVVSAEGADGLLHVGDNERSDLFNPAQRGVKTIHVPSALSLLRVNPVEADIFAAARKEYVSDEGVRIDRSDEALAAEILLGPFVAETFGSPFPSPQRGGVARTLTLSSASEMGKVLFGPLLLCFMSKLAQHPATARVEKIFFLAREGYFLLKLYQEVRARWLPGLPEGVYFCCSRRVANSASLSRNGDPLGLVKIGEGFRGTMAGMLDARLGYTVSPDSPLRAMRIVTPDEFDKARSIITLLRSDILAQTRKNAARLHVYCESLGIRTDGSALYGMVDVGYSATIQRRVQETTGARFAGLYMATGQLAASVEETGGLAFGLLAEGAAGDRFQRVCGLMIEAFLTAPHGQTMGYDDSIPPRPVFGAGGVSQKNFSVLEEIFSGALDYCRTVAEAYGAEVFGVLAQGERAATTMLGALASGRLVIAPKLTEALAVDDQFCGRGEIHIFKHMTDA